MGAGAAGVWCSERSQAMDIQKRVGKAIKLCRTWRGYSQTELAILAKISVSYLSLLERGKRDAPISTLCKLSTALNVSMIVIMFLANSDDDQLPADVREKLAHITIQIVNHQES
jgi:transcriptional regulator with XRE-family HTH domain